MKRFVYISSLVVCLMQHGSWGSEEEISCWDNDAIARIAVELRHSPFQLGDFLENIAKKKEKVEPSYALVPVLATEQITLTAQDIIEAAYEAQNFQKIFYIDLNNYDFRVDDENRQRIFSYFDQNTLGNLRVIKIYGATGVSNLIEELFGKSKPKNKYISLFRIAADKSDITNQDLDKVYNYFSKCTYFVRDMMQISARYDVTASFLSLDVREANNLTNIDSWQRGKKTPTADYSVLYRSGEERVKGPLIMSIER